jgi:hypothetical protein
MSYIHYLDKDELQYRVEEQERYKLEALDLLKAIQQGNWNHQEAGCSYGCGDGHDDNIKECDCQDSYKLEIYYKAITEAIKCLEV